MFTKGEVDYLVKLIDLDLEAGTDVCAQNANIMLANGERVSVEEIQEELNWRNEVAPKLILMLKNHRGLAINDDEKTYLWKLFMEHRQRLSHEVLHAVYKVEQVDEVIDDFDDWFRFGAQAAKKFQDQYIIN